MVLIRSGSLDKIVTFRRRGVTGPTTRGPFADVFRAYGAFRQTMAREAIQAGSVQNIANGVLTVRADSNTRTLTVADRVVIEGKEFAITGVGIPERRSGTIDIGVETRTGGP